MNIKNALNTMADKIELDKKLDYLLGIAESNHAVVKSNNRHLYLMQEAVYGMNRFLINVTYLLRKEGVMLPKGMIDEMDKLNENLKNIDGIVNFKKENNNG